jgi:hypothetical protein
LRCGAYRGRLESIESQISRLDRDCVEVKRWQAEHDGRINAYWEAQFRINSVAEEKFQGVFKRIIAVEHRVIWASGFAACGGAVVGVIASVLISKLVGG